MNYYEHGPQNSRGFRALKVWLGLRQVGRAGVTQQIADDIALAEALAQRIADTPELQVFTRHLSIVTFRFTPVDLTPGAPTIDTYLDRLNTALLERLQQGGEVFVSNAVLDGRFLLRACIVNFRTTVADIDVLPEIVVWHGRELDAVMRSQLAQSGAYGLNRGMRTYGRDTWSTPCGATCAEADLRAARARMRRCPRARHL